MSRPPDSLDWELVRDAYDAGAEELAARFPDARAEAAADLALVDAFAAAVASSASGRLLDAGCGAGRMSRYVAERGCHVEGVDLSPGMVAMARRDHPDLTFRVGSLSDLPCSERAFDGVMLWYSIIHIPPESLTSIFRAVTRVLRPGGDVLVGFQCGEGTRAVSWARQREVPLERHLHQPEHVAAQCLAAGLHEVRRLVRPAQGQERDQQAFLWLRERSSA